MEKQKSKLIVIEEYRRKHRELNLSTIRNMNLIQKHEPIPLQEFADPISELEGLVVSEVADKFMEHHLYQF